MIEFDYALAGLVTGFIVGLTGVGGGALMTPILLIVFGISPTTAVATDLWFAAFTKIAGARIHHLNGHVNWVIAKLLWLGSLPVAIFIVLLANFGFTINRADLLAKIIAVLVFITALGLLFAPQFVIFIHQAQARRIKNGEQTQVALTIASGALLGVFVALTSIGAGAIGSLILLYLYPREMTPHKLIATDIVHAIPLAIFAGVGYLFTGAVDWSMLFSLLTGSLPAVAIGSMLAGKLSGRWVQSALAIILIAISIKILGADIDSRKMLFMSDG